MNLKNVFTEKENTDALNAVVEASVNINKGENIVNNVKALAYVNTEIENIDAKNAKEHLYANTEKKKIIANNVVVRKFVNTENIKDIV